MQRLSLFFFDIWIVCDILPSFLHFSDKFWEVAGNLLTINSNSNTWKSICVSILYINNLPGIAASGQGPDSPGQTLPAQHEVTTVENPPVQNLNEASYFRNSLNIFA